MGTNYYAHVKANPFLRWIKKPEVYHIGKSSFGWCFSLHVMQTIDKTLIVSWSDWKKVLEKSNVEVYDEYDTLINKDAFYSVVTERSFKRAGAPEFDYKRNHAEPGPNGLVRHKIDDTHCIGHGLGTYDYIIGDFS